MIIMKRETILFSPTRQKTRAIELYSNESPFKARKIEPKTRYSRKIKHPKKDW